MTVFPVNDVFARDNRVIFFYIVPALLLYQPVVQVLAILRGFADRRFAETGYLTMLLAVGYKESPIA